MTMSARPRRHLRAVTSEEASGGRFRAAVAEHGTGPVVVSVDDELDRVSVAASSWQSLSLNPPLVGVAIAAHDVDGDRVRSAGELRLHLGDLSPTVLRCRVETEHAVGDHVLVVAHVLAADETDATGATAPHLVAVDAAPRRRRRRDYLSEVALRLTSQ